MVLRHAHPMTETEARQTYRIAQSWMHYDYRIVVVYICIENLFGKRYGEKQKIIRGCENLCAHSHLRCGSSHGAEFRKLPITLAKLGHGDSQDLSRHVIPIQFFSWKTSFSVNRNLQIRQDRCINHGNRGFFRSGCSDILY